MAAWYSPRKAPSTAMSKKDVAPQNTSRRQNTSVETTFPAMARLYTCPMFALQGAEGGAEVGILPRHAVRRDARLRRLCAATMHQPHVQCTYGTAIPVLARARLVMQVRLGVARSVRPLPGSCRGLDNAPRSTKGHVQHTGNGNSKDCVHIHVSLLSKRERCAVPRQAAVGVVMTARPVLAARQEGRLAGRAWASHTRIASQSSGTT